MVSLRSYCFVGKPSLTGNLSLLGLSAIKIMTIKVIKPHLLSTYVPVSVFFIYYFMNEPVMLLTLSPTLQMNKLLEQDQCCSQLFDPRHHAECQSHTRSSIHACSVSE